MDTNQHNDIVDKAWSLTAGSERLTAAGQILRMYETANNRAATLKAVKIVCATAVLVTLLCKVL